MNGGNVSVSGSGSSKIGGSGGGSGGGSPPRRRYFMPPAAFGLGMERSGGGGGGALWRLRSYAAQRKRSRLAANGFVARQALRRWRKRSLLDVASSLSSWRATVRFEEVGARRALRHWRRASGDLHRLSVLHRFLVAQQLPPVPRCGLLARCIARWRKAAAEQQRHWAILARAAVGRRRAAQRRIFEALLCHVEACVLARALLARRWHRNYALRRRRWRLDAAARRVALKELRRKRLLYQHQQHRNNQHPDDPLAADDDIRRRWEHDDKLKLLSLQALAAPPRPHSPLTSEAVPPPQHKSALHQPMPQWKQPRQPSSSSSRSFNDHREHQRCRLQQQSGQPPLQQDAEGGGGGGGRKVDFAIHAAAADAEASSDVSSFFCAPPLAWRPKREWRALHLLLRWRREFMPIARNRRRRRELFLPRALAFAAHKLLRRVLLRWQTWPLVAYRRASRQWGRFHVTPILWAWAAHVFHPHVRQERLVRLLRERRSGRGGSSAAMRVGEAAVRRGRGGEEGRRVRGGERGGGGEGSLIPRRRAPLQRSYVDNHQFLFGDAPSVSSFETSAVEYARDIHARLLPPPAPTARHQHMKRRHRQRMGVAVALSRSAPSFSVGATAAAAPPVASSFSSLRPSTATKAQHAIAAGSSPPPSPRRSLTRSLSPAKENRYHNRAKMPLSSSSSSSSFSSSSSSSTWSPPPGIGYSELHYVNSELHAMRDSVEYDSTVVERGSEIGSGGGGGSGSSRNNGAAATAAPRGSSFVRASLEADEASGSHSRSYNASRKGGSNESIAVGAS
jgi:hypothetical protein